MPPIPPKTYANNSDTKLNKRLFMLNRFVKELVKNPILLESAEFGLFMNSANDFKDTMQNRPKTSTLWLLDKLKPYFYM